MAGQEGGVVVGRGAVAEASRGAVHTVTRAKQGGRSGGLVVVVVDGGVEGLHDGTIGATKLLAKVG